MPAPPGGAGPVRAAGGRDCRRRTSPRAWPRSPPELEACDRVEQPALSAVGSEPQMLPPQPEPEFTGEYPGPVAKAARVDGRARGSLLVEDRACDLGVMGPGAPVEVGRAHHRPDVVDHDGLGVDVDRRPLLVLQVVHGHPRPAGADQVADGPPLGGPRGPALGGY